MKEIDSIDHKILETLRKNADLANKVLADKIGLSPSACLRRVARLKDIGTIQGIVAVVDPDCLDLKLTVIVTVKFEKTWPRAIESSFFKQLEKENAISQCYMVSGEVGSILTMNVADMEEYTQLADRLFHADENISAFTTHMVMSSLK